MGDNPSAIPPGAMSDYPSAIPSRAMIDNPLAIPSGAMSDYPALVELPSAMNDRIPIVKNTGSVRSVRNRLIAEDWLLRFGYRECGGIFWCLMDFRLVGRDLKGLGLVEIAVDFPSAALIQSFGIELRWRVHGDAFSAGRNGRRRAGGLCCGGGFRLERRLSELLVHVELANDADPVSLPETFHFRAAQSWRQIYGQRERRDQSRLNHGRFFHSTILSQP